MHCAASGSRPTLPDQLVCRAVTAPASEAFIRPGLPSVTAAELMMRMQAVASALAGHGIGRADRVAVALPAGVPMAVACLGVTGCAVAAPLDPRTGHADTEFNFTHLRIAALITDTDVDCPAREVAARRNIPVVELSSTVDLVLADPSPGGVSAAPDDLALVLHTSGTTSRPKIVPLTHANVYASCVNIASAYGLGERDRCLNINHLFHAHGLMVMFASLLSGGSVSLLPPWDVSKVFAWLASVRPTWYSAVPSIHQTILASAREEGGGRPDFGLRFIRSSSAPLAPQTLAELERVFKAPVVESYGMTEAAMQITTNPLPPGIRKPGSVGRPAGPEVGVVDATGREVAAEQVGEIRIRGANVISAYEGGETPSARDGWLSTGDLGYFDADRYLFITGRTKELINRGGEKISPLDIDRVLLSHPAVARAAAFAVPDPDLGEDVGAAVVLRPDACASVRDLRGFAADRLPPFKVPRWLLIVESIPTGPTGKYQRDTLAHALDVLGHRASAGAVSASGAERLQVSVSPRGDLQHEIAAIWSSIVGCPAVSATDDLLGIGGHSIHAMRIVAQIRARFHVEIPSLTLLEGTTVASLADMVEGLTREAQ